MITPNIVNTPTGTPMPTAILSPVFIPLVLSFSIETGRGASLVGGAVVGVSVVGRAVIGVSVVAGSAGGRVVIFVDEVKVEIEVLGVDPPAALN
jgi:hypothetical protein